MCLPKAIKDKDAHLNLPKGCQTLSAASTPSATSGCARPTRAAISAGWNGSAQMLAAIAKKAASPRR